MTAAYIYLVVAIVFEVIATSALKACEGFTKVGPSSIVVLGYMASFYFFSIVLKTMPVGVAYAIWCGLGIIMVTLVGVFLYGQTPDLPAVLGMVLIMSGVGVINYFSKTIVH
ncbi:multidrug efflux SMR transporter [Desulfovibrio sp. JC022]|uniref:DMT family transporter n=1 Tax=Desulfovibrio sp. JC022 TaxID=2593642 RepID=UPI0013CF8C88|nr:multidrug efflux SMR transporter [Desulfovibrio sp. JC022]NDV23999.1 multidrug efflux SMR transporter [Desulfovibrio sp. JC022]